MSTVRERDCSRPVRNERCTSIVLVVIKCFSILFVLIFPSIRLLASDAPVVVPMKPYIGALKTVEVRINHRSFSFLFDTAGGLTVVTPQTAKAIDCTPYGKLVVHRMTGETVSFQKCGEKKLTINGVDLTSDITVLDLMSLLPEGVPEIAGIISLHTLETIPFTLSLRKNQIVIETPATLEERMKNSRPMRLRVARSGGGGAIDAFVAVKGQKSMLWFELDSANLDDVLIAPETASELGVHPVESKTETIPVSLELYGLPPIEADVRVRDLIYDGALNERFMEQFEFTFDLAGGKLWVRPL